MKHTKTQHGITFLIVILGSLFITAQRAQADSEWVKKIVSVPYTYYDYETQTRYRLVRKAFTVTEYRHERRAVTTYRYERQRVAVEVPTGRCGVTRIKHVWKDVKVPETTYETIRVPYEKTVYKTVREPYYVRVRVARTGYRSEAQWVKVHVPNRKHKRGYADSSYLSTGWSSSGGGFSLTIGLGGSNRGDRKRDSFRNRDNHKTRRDNFSTARFRTTRSKRNTDRRSSRRDRRDRSSNRRRGRR